jgi:hypothetical protein
MIECALSSQTVYNGLSRERGNAGEVADACWQYYIRVSPSEKEKARELFGSGIQEIKAGNSGDFMFITPLMQEKQCDALFLQLADGKKRIRLLADE